jgi:hypothetical protein
VTGLELMTNLAFTTEIRVESAAYGRRGEAKFCLEIFRLELIVPADAGGSAVSQDFDRGLGTFVLGPDQEKLPTVRECHGVGFDNFVGHMIIGQVGLESLNDRLVIWFSPGGRFGGSPNYRGSGTRREDQPETMRFSRDNSLIEDGVFEARPRQMCHRLIHISGVIKYSDDCSHQSRYEAAIVAKPVSVARYFTLAIRARIRRRCTDGKMHRKLVKKTWQILANYRRSEVWAILGSIYLVVQRPENQPLTNRRLTPRKDLYQPTEDVRLHPSIRVSLCARISFRKSFFISALPPQDRIASLLPFALDICSLILRPFVGGSRKSRNPESEQTVHGHNILAFWTMCRLFLQT